MDCYLLRVMRFVPAYAIVLGVLSACVIACSDSSPGATPGDAGSVETGSADGGGQVVVAFEARAGGASSRAALR